MEQKQNNISREYALERTLYEAWNHYHVVGIAIRAIDDPEILTELAHEASTIKHDITKLTIQLTSRQHNSLTEHVQHITNGLPE